MIEYTVIVEKGTDGYYTYSPELTGCTSFGVTTEEAVDNMREAIREHLQILAEDGIKAPEIRPSYITKEPWVNSMQ